MLWGDLAFLALLKYTHVTILQYLDGCEVKNVFLNALKLIKALEENCMVNPKKLINVFKRIRFE